MSYGTQAVVERSGTFIHGGRRAARPYSIRLGLMLVAALGVALIAAPASASMVRIDAYGTNGAGNGQFNAPQGVAVNQASGALYVVENTNSRISKFSASGSFLRAWGGNVDADDPSTGAEICVQPAACKTGSNGAASGVFTNPMGVAVNSTSGHVYVSDLGNRRVQQFDSDGNFIRAWGWGVNASVEGSGFEVCAAGETCQTGSTGAGDGQFGSAATGRIALNPGNGDVYVADPTNRRVQRFSASGEFLGKFGSAGTGTGQFGANQPQHIAIDPSGNVYAGDSNASNRVQKFNAAGEYLSQISAPPLFSSATTGLAAHPTSGNLFVLRATDGATVVQEFTPAGELIDVHGAGDGISTASGIAVRATPRRLFLTTTLVGQRWISVLAEAEPEATTRGAAPRTSTTARLNALVDPNGNQSTYHFEYGPDASYGNSAPPSKNGDAGDGALASLVSTELTGLQPSTTYHFRIVVEHDGGTVYGEDATFTTRSVAEMNPPARGYEMINDPDKGNQSIGTTEVGTMAPGGDDALWSVSAGAPNGMTGAGNPFLATRTDSGWVSQNIVPPPAEQFGGGSYHYKVSGASSQFNRFVFFVDQGVLTTTPYAVVRSELGKGSTILQEYPAGNSEAAMGSLAINSDLNRVAINYGTQVFEIGSGVSKLATVMPDGEPAECGLLGYSWKRPAASNWLTSEGGHLFFVAPAQECGSETRLYRRNLNTETTTEVSGVRDHGAGGTTLFLGASDDGTAAVHVTTTALTADDQDVNWDLYRFEDGAGNTCLTCVADDAQVRIGNLANAFQPILASDDLSRIYFESSRRLAPGADVGGGLYVWHDDEIRFVATSGEFLTGQSLPADAGVIFFEAEEDLTGDGTEGARQIYRYDDANGALECVSCSAYAPAHQPVGDPFLGASFAQGSADASTLAFLTMSALVPSDVNGDVDAYEWRNGVTRLVTDGETEHPVGLGRPTVRGIDATGKNITFTSTGRLTGFEQEETGSLYSARIGGGFKREAPPAHCVEDSCQGPLAPAPQPLGASSGAVVMPGNSKANAKKRRKAQRKAQRQRAQRKAQRQRAQRKRAAAKRRANRVGKATRNG